MKKTFKRVVAGILILVTCMSSFVYGTEFDELYRGENLGALWYSEFDSDGTGVNQMEGLVYIGGVLTAVPAVCINPDVPGMAELEYGDLYSSNISVANSSLRKAMFYGHSTAASAAMKAEYYEDYEDVSLALAEARGYGGGYAYLVTHHAAAKIYGDPLWNSGGYGTTISQALQNDCIAYIERIANLPEPPEIYEVHVAKKTDYQDYAFEIIKPIEKGHLTLKKVSGNPGLSDGNRCYSIVGTTYEVYDNANLSGSPIATLVVKDEEGNADLVKVEKGTYYFKETVAGEGYALKSFDASTDYVTVTAANTESNPAVFNTQDIPQNNSVDILIAKLDSETGAASPQGEGTLAGAEFEVAYYDAYFDTLDSVSGKAKATWVFKTDEFGVIRLEEAYKVSGPAFYTDSKGNATMPLGTLVMKETKAPTGYLPTNEVALRKITANTSTEKVSTLNQYTVEEKAVRGGVKGNKIDQDRNAAIPQGDATLEGAEFTVFNSKGEEVLVLSTDANGYYESAKDALVFGNYTIKETKAPRGYHLNTKWKGEFSITKDGDLADFTKDPVDEPIYKGGVMISKIDADLDKAYSQGDATLEGAEFTIYNKSVLSVMMSGKEIDKELAVKVITTDKEGNATTGKYDLPFGTYVIIETKPSKGYLLNTEWKKTFEIREDGVIVDLTEEKVEEPIIHGGVKVSKVDSELLEAYPQGDATLEGAEFTIYNKSEHNVFVNGEEFGKDAPVLVITTNKEGIATSKDNDFPYGTYLIKETKASEGYKVNETWEKTFEVREDKVIIDLTEESVPEEVIRGGVQIVKRDKELAKSEAIGGATLEGIVMTIKNMSGHDILVRTDISTSNEVDWTKVTAEDMAEGGTIKRVKSGEDIGKIIVHWNEEKKAYTAETFSDDLPYGTYTIRESKTNASYQRTDKKEHRFTIREDGTVSFDDGTNDEILTFDNYVYRSDVQGTKIGDGDSVRFSYVPFKIISVSTGETHVVMADKNGFFTTKDRRTKDALEEDEVGESARIQNPLDDLMEEKELTYELLEKRSGDILYGAWFGTGEFGTETEMNNTYGALPYDSYILEEMSCEQNAGYTLQKFFFTVDEKSQNGFVDLETITDDVPEIGTTASVNGKNANISPSKEITLVDKIEYRNLKKGETYIAKGKLIDKATGLVCLDAQGKEITAETEFVAKKVNGKVKVTFTFDGSNMWDKETVVFESVYDTEGHLVAKHEDIEDEDQTVTWKKTETPKIGTTLTDDSGNKVIITSETTVLVDTISYEGLYTDEWYVASGILMVKETGDPLVENGKAVSVESEPFKPKSEDGEVKVSFTINTAGLEGKELVAFEVISRLDGFKKGDNPDETPKTPVAEHQNLEDEGQTVTIIKPEEPTPEPEPEPEPEPQPEPEPEPKPEPEPTPEPKPEPTPEQPKTPETPKITNPPRTGDSSQVSLYAGLGVAALLSLILAAYAHEQKNEKNRKNK